MPTIQTHTFEKRSEFNASITQLQAYHDAPETMPRLSPPPIFIQMLRDERDSLTSGELEFRLWFGPIPIHWVARHESGPTQNSFADLMVKGPMAYWRHEHIFEPTQTGTILIDRVTLAHHTDLRGMITRLMFDGLPLRFLFFYRHLRTRLDLRKFKDT